MTVAPRAALGEVAVEEEQDHEPGGRSIIKSAQRGLDEWFLSHEVKPGRSVREVLVNGRRQDSRLECLVVAITYSSNRHDNEERVRCQSRETGPVVARHRPELSSHTASVVLHDERNLEEGLARTPEQALLVCSNRVYQSKSV